MTQDNDWKVQAMRDIGAQTDSSGTYQERVRRALNAFPYVVGGNKLFLSTHCTCGNVAEFDLYDNMVSIKFSLHEEKFITVTGVVPDMKWIFAVVNLELLETNIRCVALIVARSLLAMFDNCESLRVALKKTSDPSYSGYVSSLRNLVETLKRDVPKVPAPEATAVDSDQASLLEASLKQDAILVKLERIYRKVMGSFPLKLTSSMHGVEDLGMDSLDQTEFLMEVEDEFHVEITDNDRANMRTADDVVKYLNQHCVY